MNTTQGKNMGTKVLNVAKSYWWVIVFIFALGGWATSVEIGQASSAAKDKQQDEIIKKQVEISVDQQKLMRELKGQIDVLMVVFGITVSDTTVARWKKMSKKIPLDSTGKPIDGGVWLCISGDKLLARTFKWVNNDSLLVRVEWDEREHRSRP